MVVSAETWQARAALCELLALSFRYPEDEVLASAVASGEWTEAACEIASALDLDWPCAEALAESKAAVEDEPHKLRRTLRAEATRLFVGAPEAAASPYEAVWRSEAEGVKPLLFANPHSMAVERFCKACGLGRPEGVNEPLDAVWTELELLERLALQAAADAVDGERGLHGAGVPSFELPDGSSGAAWERFMEEHAREWMPSFAAGVREASCVPFYRAAASLLAAFAGKAASN